MLPAIKQVRGCKCEKLPFGWGNFPGVCFCDAVVRVLLNIDNRFASVNFYNGACCGLSA